ncbi:protein MAIN-LIKE 1-like [Arachis ipaensis]|uniref:protein MAIN-LIKE 1-like n=1 Tax=Arachis ipaensis TaxID=130454 RepID=UPI000A2AFD4C|nr:protein MAIN-LIKE 1-like [Arachis ipaensis]
MPFGECTITLQDVAYQLGLPVDGRYVSGCLSEFHIYIEGGRPAWVWFEELFGVVPPPSQVQKYAVNCSWFQETFGECPEGADEDTVRRYARAYIMMLLGTQLFADKSGNRVHIRWLPFVARLEEMGTYSWGSAALAWLYRCMCRVANRNVIKLAGPLQLLQSWIFWRFPRFRPAGFETFSWPLASRWSGYIPSSSEKGPRVQTWRLWIDRLQDREVSMLLNKFFYLTTIYELGSRVALTLYRSGCSLSGCRTVALTYFRSCIPRFWSLGIWCCGGLLHRLSTLPS